MDVNLTGKFIFITGGTSALGRIFVRRALEEGAAIFFTYHQNIEQAKQLEALGAKGFQINLAKHSEIDQLKRDLQLLTRHLDAVIHNAAIVRDHTIQNLTDEDWDQVLSVNLSAVYYLTKKFLSFLFRRPHQGVIASEAKQSMSSEIASVAALPRNDGPRKILNIVSRVGLQGRFGEANYAAAKGGLMALTKTLAQELGKKQILVNALNPGFMKSRMTESIPEEAFKRQIEDSVLGSISDPEEVSNLMVYLLSDRFQHVSGQTFHFDSRRI